MYITYSKHMNFWKWGKHMNFHIQAHVLAVIDYIEDFLAVIFTMLLKAHTE